MLHLLIQSHGALGFQRQFREDTNIQTTAHANKGNESIRKYHHTESTGKVQTSSNYGRSSQASGTQAV